MQGNHNMNYTGVGGGGGGILHHHQGAPLGHPGPSGGSNHHTTTTSHSHNSNSNSSSSGNLNTTPGVLPSTTHSPNMTTSGPMLTSHTNPMSGNASSTSHPHLHSSRIGTASSSGSGSSSSGGGGGGSGVNRFCLIACDDPSSSSDSSSSPTPNVLLLFGLPWYVREKEIDKYLVALYPTASPMTTRLYIFPHNGVSRGICFVEYPKVEGGRRGSATAAAGSFLSLSSGLDDSLGYGGSGGGGAFSSTSTTTGRRRRRSGVMGGGGMGMTSFHTSASSLSSFAGYGPGGTGSSGGGASGAGEVAPVDLWVIQRRILSHPWEGRIPLLARCYYLPMISGASSSLWDRSGTLPPLPQDPPQSKALLGYGEEGRRVRCGATLEIPNTCTSIEAYAKVELCRKRLRKVMENKKERGSSAPNPPTVE